MADNAEAQVESTDPGGGGGNKLLMILVVVNMVVILGIGAMIYLNKQKEEAAPGLDDVIETTAAEDAQSKEADDSFIGKLIPMETFMVNLAGGRGSRLAKVNMELEVDGGEVQTEIEKRKPQIRDIVIIILSSKTYQQVATKDGKDSLREEIKDTLNSFLTKGAIKRVYFTDFLFQ